MATQKRNFRLKMHQATSNDELRPVMQHIYFDNGFMIATDGHILIKSAVQHFSDFDQSEIDILNGKFLHKSTFKKILSAKMVMVTEEGVVDIATNDIYKFSNLNEKYPNYEAVIPNGGENIDEIAINPNVAKKLFAVLSTSDLYNIRMKFSGKAKAILFTSSGDLEGALKAILMPVMITD